MKFGSVAVAEAEGAVLAHSHRLGPGQIVKKGQVLTAADCRAWMADIGSFCIDTTEVTNVMYGAFLAAKPSRALQPAACAWNVERGDSAVGSAHEDMVYITVVEVACNDRD